MPDLHLHHGWIAATVAAVAFEAVFPLALAVIVHRRLGMGWRYFAYGALIFLVFQLLSRVPVIFTVSPALVPQLKASRTLLFQWMATLAITAAFFEEGGRWLGYRLLMRREEKTWSKALMYGLGHGGLESIVLSAGLTLVALVAVERVSSGGLASLPEAQRASVARELAVFASQPAWIPLLGAWERLWSIALQVAMSVVVLQAFRRGSLIWLWAAILAHSVIDFTSIACLQILGPRNTSAALLTEALIAVYGAIGLWVIWRLRDRPEAAAGAAVRAP